MTTLAEEFNYRYQGAFACVDRGDNNRLACTITQGASVGDKQYREGTALVVVSAHREGAIQVPLKDLDLAFHVPTIISVPPTERHPKHRVIYSSQMPVRTSRKGFRFQRMYMVDPVSSETIDGRAIHPQFMWTLVQELVNPTYYHLREAINILSASQKKNEGVALSENFWLSSGSAINPKGFVVGYGRFIVGKVDIDGEEIKFYLDPLFVDLVELAQIDLDIPVRVADPSIYEGVSLKVWNQFFDKIPATRLREVRRFFQSYREYEDVEVLLNKVNDWRLFTGMNIINDEFKTRKVRSLLALQDSFGESMSQTAFHNWMGENPNFYLTDNGFLDKERFNNITDIDPISAATCPLTLLLLSPTLRLSRSLKRRGHPEDKVKLGINYPFIEEGTYQVAKTWNKQEDFREAFKRWVDRAFSNETDREFKNWLVDQTRFCFGDGKATQGVPEGMPRPMFDLDDMPDLVNEVDDGPVEEAD